MCRTIKYANAGTQKKKRKQFILPPAIKWGIKWIANELLGTVHANALSMHTRYFYFLNMFEAVPISKVGWQHSKEGVTISLRPVYLIVS